MVAESRFAWARFEAALLGWVGPAWVAGWAGPDASCRHVRQAWPAGEAIFADFCIVSALVTKNGPMEPTDMGEGPAKKGGEGVGEGDHAVGSFRRCFRLPASSERNCVQRAACKPQIWVANPFPFSEPKDRPVRSESYCRCDLT